MMHATALCTSMIGLATSGGLGLTRSARSRGLSRSQEITFWIVWAVVGSWLLVSAGLFLFVPFLAFVFLFQLLAGRAVAAVPAHLRECR